MKISKKTMFAKLFTAMISALVLAIAFSFSTVSVVAMAVDDTLSVKAVTIEEVPAEENNTYENAVQLGSVENMTFEINMLDNVGDSDFILLAGGGGSSGSGSSDADSSYKSVVEFFITWIRRVGALIGFVGAVMFALAIKNNDAEQKQNGLLTMVAGFVVVAVCTAINMFDLFS